MFTIYRKEANHKERKERREVFETKKVGEQQNEREEALINGQQRRQKMTDTSAARVGLKNHTK